MTSILVALLLINLPAALFLAYWFWPQHGNAAAARRNPPPAHNQVRKLSEFDRIRAMRQRLDRCLIESVFGDEQQGNWHAGSQESILVSRQEVNDLRQLLRDVRQTLHGYEQRRSHGAGPSSSPERLQSTNGPGTIFDPTAAAPLDDEFRLGIEKIRAPQSGAERRRSDRQGVSFLINSIPLNSQWDIDDEPFEALARDVSNHGVSFCHTNVICSPNLALELLPFNSPPIYVLVQVRHSRIHGPYFVTGCEFQSRLTGGPLVAALRRSRALRSAPARN